MSQFFTSAGQSIEASASTSVLPANTRDWSPLGWTGWISLQSKGHFKSLLQHRSSKASILLRSSFFIVQLSHSYMTNGKTIALTRRTFVGKVISLLFNKLSRLVITFLPRSKRLLISCLQSPSAVILEPQKINSDTVSTVSPFIFHEVMGHWFTQKLFLALVNSLEVYHLGAGAVGEEWILEYFVVERVPSGTKTLHKWVRPFEDFW